MKKIILFSAALVAALALASCNKEKTGTPVEYETPVYSDLAVKFDIDNTTINNGLNGTKKYNSFEVTELGEYLILDKNGNKTGKIGNIDAIKGSDKGDKVTYECNGFGKVIVEAATKAASVVITFQPDGEPPLSLSATPVETSETINKEFLRKIARKWKIAATIISVSGGDIPSSLGVAKKFDGCNFEAIKKYVEEKSESKINMGDITKYVIDYVQVTGCGTFMVMFTNGESVSADLELNTESKDKATLKYEISGEQPGIAIFKGVADGEIRFDKQGNCEIEVNAQVDVNKKDYVGKVIFVVNKI